MIHPATACRRHFEMHRSPQQQDNLTPRLGVTLAKNTNQRDPRASANAESARNDLPWAPCPQDILKVRPSNSLDYRARYDTPFYRYKTYLMSANTKTTFIFFYRYIFETPVSFWNHPVIGNRRAKKNITNAPARISRCRPLCCRRPLRSLRSSCCCQKCCFCCASASV